MSKGSSSWKSPCPHPYKGRASLWARDSSVWRKPPALRHSSGGQLEIAREKRLHPSSMGVIVGGVHLSMSVKLLEECHALSGVGSLSDHCIFGGYACKRGVGKGIRLGQQESVFCQGPCILCSGPHPRILAVSPGRSHQACLWAWLPLSAAQSMSCPLAESPSLDPSVDLFLVSFSTFWACFEAQSGEFCLVIWGPF